MSKYDVRTRLNARNAATNLAWLRELAYNLAKSLASSSSATTPLPFESAPNDNDCRQIHHNTLSHTVFTHNEKHTQRNTYHNLISCCSHNCLEHLACPMSMSSHHHLSRPLAKILVSTVNSRHHHLTLTMLSWTSKWLLLL